MNTRAIVVGVIACLVGVLIGRLATPAPPEPFSPSVGAPVVATFRGGQLGVEAVHHELRGRDPAQEPKYATPEGRAELLEKAVREELLVREAVRRGLHRDPEVLASLRATLVQQLLQREIDQNDARKQVSEAELQAAYQAHLSDYVRPELRQFSQIFRPATDAKSRARVREELEALKVELQRDDAAFARAAGAEGTLGLAARAELEKRLGAEWAEAAWKLEQVGKIEGPVETAAGLALVRLEARYEGLDLSLEQVREQLKSRLWFERRPQQLQAFSQELREGADLKVDAAALEAAFKKR